MSRYFGEDLLKLTPGQQVDVDVSQDHIDHAIPGDKRNCAFVLAIHSACDAVYRAEVGGNDVFIWIEIQGGEKWKLDFYMTEEVWELATMFDLDKSKVKPVTIPIHFHGGMQVNRASGQTRKQRRFKPTVVGGKKKPTLVSQTLAAAQKEIEGAGAPTNGNEPVVKPIAVPGQRVAAAAITQSRFARVLYMKPQAVDTE